MIAYIDSSIVLRIAFEEPEPLREWSTIRAAFASELLAIEVRRSLDPLWLRHELTEDEFEGKAAEAEALLRQITQVELERRVLDRAAQPFPAPLGTLDAFHLATALLLRDSRLPGEQPMAFATHDVQLARAARAMQFEVIGA